MKQATSLDYRAWAFSGPLASWCRNLITTRCVACGGRRDGEDLIEATAHFHEDGHRMKFRKSRNLIRDQRTNYSIEGLPTPCPLCGFPAHPMPPHLAIPGVVKPETRR